MHAWRGAALSLIPMPEKSKDKKGGEEGGPQKGKIGRMDRQTRQGQKNLFYTVLLEPQKESPGALHF